MRLFPARQGRTVGNADVPPYRDAPAKGGAALRRADIWLAALVLLIAGGWLLARHCLTADGARAVVITEAGERFYDLHSDQELTLTGHDGIVVHMEIADGRARFSASDCPDGLCVASGWLSRTGQTAACVPARITLRIDGGNTDGVDAVAQ